MARQFVLAACIAVLAVSCARSDAPPAAAHRTDIRLPLDSETIEARVPRHATLDSLLRQHGLPTTLVVSAVDSVRAVFDPRHLRADRPYRLVRSLDGLLREFEYEIDADRFLRIVSPDREQPERLEAEVLPIEKETSVVAVRGQIDADHPSLIAAVDESGEQIQLALALAEIFGGQIDFESDLQSGDSFEVLFEKSTREGQFAGYGEILGARFTADGTLHQAFRWADRASGKAAYYDEQGRSLKRTFLRSPLKFAPVPRVTSSFSRRRLHPVHRVYRAHLGVDYGAAYGAPVVAVASGVVVSAGWAGGGGRQVRLRHASGMETYYLHLSRFAKGLRAGQRVDQGQLVGYVGSSGTATGPHLDYRLKKNGVFVNPLVEHRKQPPGQPIPSAQLADFRQERDGMLTRLSAFLLAEGARQKPDAVKAIQ
jgi:murein DD-endopeptidase MepM/ murein hydrolase activator NlpD